MCDQTFQQVLEMLVESGVLKHIQDQSHQTVLGNPSQAVIATVLSFLSHRSSLKPFGEEPSVLRSPWESESMKRHLILTATGHTCVYIGMSKSKKASIPPIPQQLRC